MYHDKTEQMGNIYLNKQKSFRLNKYINHLLNCKCNYILTSEQGHRIIKCLKCGDVKPI